LKILNGGNYDNGESIGLDSFGDIYIAGFTDNLNGYNNYISYCNTRISLRKHHYLHLAILNN